MKNKKKKIDWSCRKYKQGLIDTRRILWRNDTIDMITKWLDLRSGMRVVDMGCGLGYLGHTFWPYLKKRGIYVGVDINRELLPEAKKTAKTWAKRQTFFVGGDAYKIPLASNSADCVMCQTLLMHIKDPAHVLGEFFRVLKPGGIVVCMEPDELSYRDIRTEPGSA